MSQQTFTLTDEHILLLRGMYVGWCDDEFGAPEIDPKRPYGNSHVLGDIHEIMTGDSAYSNNSDLAPDDETLARYERLHKETQTALQIVLATGSFEPGEYVASEYRIDWERKPF